jgi:ketosteroid isomerase-like protein
MMPMSVDAHLLFPSDAPKGAQQAPAAGGSVPTAAVKAVEPGDAAKLFTSEVSPAEHDGVVERLEVLADAVRLGGDADRAAALTEASVILAADAEAAGMPSDDLRAIMEHAHEASATLTPLTPEQLADGRAKAMQELADVPPEDIAAAQGLIATLSQKMPSLVYQLEATGLGNSPEFIRAVIKESRRRGYR